MTFDHRLDDLSPVESLGTESDFLAALRRGAIGRVVLVAAENSKSGKDGGIATHNAFIDARYAEIRVERALVWLPRVPQRVLNAGAPFELAAVAVLNLLALLQLLPSILGAKGAAIEFPEYGGTFLLPAMIARWLRHNVIVRVHGGRAFDRESGAFGGPGGSRVAYWFESRLLRCADFVLFVSRFMVDVYLKALGALPGGIYLSRPGFNPRFFEQAVTPGSSRNSVLFFGTLSSEKGFDDFCRLASRLKGRTSLSFRAAGRASRQAMKKLREYPNLTYLGPLSQDNILLELQSALFAVLPYRNEPFGLATAEAMAAGCVVITCNEGGAREIVEHGVSGFLFDRDHFVDQAEAVVVSANFEGGMGLELVGVGARARLRARELMDG